MDGERRCEAQAAQQYGVISRRQALGLGLTARRLESRVESGAWEAVFPKVYRMAGAPRSWSQDAAAALLWAHPPAVLSHDTAAYLWGLEGFERFELHIALPAGRRRPASGPPLRLHERWRLDRSDVRLHRGCRVTSVARTLIDLTGRVPDDHLERALDQALVLQLTHCSELRRRLCDLRAHGRCVGPLPGLLEARSGEHVGDSVLESRFSRLLRRSGLPLPETQHEVRDARGAFVARVDFAYPGLALAIQCEGYRWHAGRSRFVKDLHQRNRLQELGWRILHVTHEDLRDRPAELLVRLKSLLSFKHHTQPGV